MTERIEHRWRDHLQVHPAAAKMAKIEPHQFAELCRDIKANGLLMPVVFLRQRGGRLVVLDGCNRLDAMEAIGELIVTGDGRPPNIKCEIIEADKDFDAEAYVYSVNVPRRHLSREALRERIEEELKKHPERTDRQIAQDLGASKDTVRRTRSNSNGALRHNTNRTEASGRKARGRKPGAKRKLKSEAAPEPAPRPAEPPPLPEPPSPVPPFEDAILGISTAITRAFVELPFNDWTRFIERLRELIDQIEGELPDRKQQQIDRGRPPC